MTIHKASNENDWQDELLHQAEEADAFLRRLAAQYSVDQVLAACYVLLAIRHSETFSSDIERLAFALYRTDVGGSNSPTPEIITRAIDATKTLVCQSLLGKRLSSQVQNDPLGEILDPLRIDVTVVRGSAYPEQITEEIREIAGRFDAWFKRRLGGAATELVEILWSIGEALQNKLNEWLPDGERRLGITFGQDQNPAHVGADSDEVPASSLAFVTEEAFARIPICREDCRLPSGAPPSEGAWKALIALIGSDRGKTRTAKDLLAIRARPLICLDDGRVLLAGLTNATDALRDALYAEAKQDQVFYERFQRWRSDWLEKKAAELLERVFGSSLVYRSLSYPNPDKPGQNAIAELDMAIKWGPFLLLIETKAQQFRLEGQLGDVGRLRTDLKKNLEDAFDQARRAYRYVQAVEVAEFRETKRPDRILRVRAADLRRISLVTVSLRSFANLVTKLSRLQPLGLFTGGEFPWAICLADLDLVTRFAKTPDVLLHYVERRLEVQNWQPFLLADEVELFGAYLRTRLHPTAFSDIMSRQPHGIWLTDFQARFDEWFEWSRGWRTEAPKIGLDVPSTIACILAELRRREEEGARWIAFCLLGLSNEQLEVISSMINTASQRQQASGMLGRLVRELNDLVVSVVVTSDHPVAVLQKRTEELTVIEKYRRRISRSIGFGIHLGYQDTPFQCCAWRQGPWERDPKIEQMLAHEPSARPARGQQMPGRNEPCFCGSGKKFKKCCRLSLAL